MHVQYLGGDRIKLWLDDTRPKPPEYDVAVNSAQDAITLLKTGQVTEISLDHDLGDEKLYGNGDTVALWIEHAAYNGLIPRLIWHLHTANSVGRKNMRMALESADRYWEHQDDNV